MYAHPTQAELASASKLLATTTLPELLLLLDAVVTDILAGSKKDLYFQYAIRHFELRLAVRGKEEERRTEEQAEKLAVEEERRKVEQEEREAGGRRAQRSLAWSKLSIEHKAMCVQLAHGKQISDTGRDRILNGSIDHPPLEVLAEMEILLAERNPSLSTPHYAA